MGAAFFCWQADRCVAMISGWNLFLFADFVADQGASSSAAHSAQRAAKHCIAHQTTCYSAHAGADLCIRWVSAAPCQRDKGSSSDRN